MPPKKEANKKPYLDNQKWTLVCDELKFDVKGQFPIEEINLGTVGGSFHEITTLNMAHPITQWTKGLTKTITFESMFWANHEKEDVQVLLNSLVATASYSDQLKRQPICLFKYGKAIQFKCFVDSISNIRSGFLRPDGTFRDIRFTITLRKYVESQHVPTDPNKPEQNTFYYRVKTGDLYETVAYKHYDHAIFGEVVRRFNGHKPDLAEGDIVIVPKLNYVLQRRKIKAQSSVLGENDEAEARLVELFDERSTELNVIG